MFKTAKKLFVYVLIGGFVALPFCTSAFAYEGLGEPTVFSTFIDVLLYRPIGLLAIPVGFGLFVISLPFSATGDNVKKSYDNLVVAPTQFTFKRPLGEIDP